jgi:succinylglutamic semialdehyde dehydrogenase
VFDDCDLERTVRELAFSAFATAGQRCTATSRVVVTKGIAAPLSERLAAVAKSVVVGHVFDEGVFMGPLISDAARRALLEAQERAVRHGFLALVEGGAAKVSGREGFYVRPAIHVAPAKVTSLAGYTDTELFAPDLSVVVVESVEDAIAVANDTPFGLSSAVFTRDRAIFEACVDGLEVGVLHWNRSSAGASGRLPFGGIKGSGNHRPAGILMGQSCAYPLGVLMPPLQEGPLPSWPGITF